MIEITQREMGKAFRSHNQANIKLEEFQLSRMTCLFYAAECGLKSVIMKRENHRTSLGIESQKFAHNINKMLDYLRCERNLRLPSNIILPSLKYPTQQQRKADQSDLNQVWRYGVELPDSQVNNQIIDTLSKICAWVKEQR